MQYVAFLNKRYGIAVLLLPWKLTKSSVSLTLLQTKYSA